MMSPLLFSKATVADRIETAYLRQRGWWRHAFPHSKVWVKAAATLLSAHRSDSRLPLDPELFVASQPFQEGLADPWGDLTSPRAIERYRKRVRAIIRQLRRELISEIRWVHRRLERGLPLDLVLETKRQSLTPLGRYIVALRGGREDLAALFIEEAIVQHQGSPLYREACQGLLPEDLYPADLPGSFPTRDAEGRPREALFSLN